MSDIAHAFAAAIALLGSLDPELIGIVAFVAREPLGDRDRHGGRRPAGRRRGGERAGPSATVALSDISTTT
jgi:hypothetical protein